MEKHTQDLLGLARWSIRGVNIVVIELMLQIILNGK